MKKKIATIALALIALTTLGVNAQNNTSCQNEACPNQQGTPGENNRMYQPREFTEMAFEGILLEPEQQTRITEINNQMREQQCQRQNPNDSCSANGQQCRPDRRGQRGHGARPEGPKPVCREYVNQVKEVLTPEQYITFLENILFMNAPQDENGEAVNSNARTGNPRQQMRQLDNDQQRTLQQRANRPQRPTRQR